MNFIKYVDEPCRLLLVWQAPEGGSPRNRRTVGELYRHAETTELVSFKYLQGTPEFAVAQTEGFVAFSAFRKLDQVYNLGVVETFIRRLPPRTRADYPQYLEQFRLQPNTEISDYALLGYTGAKLPSDGFSIVMPFSEHPTRCDFLLEVAGFRHVSKIPCDEITLGEPATFVPEPENRHDPGAVAIHLRDQKIGYVPRQQCEAVRRWLGQGALSATVERVNGRAERPLVFLFLRVDVAAESRQPTRRLY